MIQEVPYGTYIEMPNNSNNDLNNLNNLPISIVIVPSETHKVIEDVIVYNRVISHTCQIIIIIIMLLPIILVLISVTI
jgi:hypothetical protein